ncbi:LysR family transcriptional regulator [Aliidongia dinghuensis]|uniref:LysR family transcriptional regulator n=1 Tax=Aliidongia dinghuensis TaxID=1867774 RepID=A0A8J2YX61_9PROT|nr:LysR substrate-binding domain-containing protein [Aliidongia dinghuensis]GGF32291.1 LysR family transcriptional regulator [Aliidongia dinghuensis]
MRLTNLDMDVLRTLVTAIELGGFARAAARLGRSQSAVSLQMRRLEEQLGATLLRKQGRGLALTEAGDVVLGYARRILALNDETVAAVRGLDLAGAVKLGLPQDFAEVWLPAALGRFARAHPQVRIEARVDRNFVLLEELTAGRLDLALIWGEAQHPGAEVVARLPIRWIGRSDVSFDPAAPLPLIAFQPPCQFRTDAIAALDRIGRPWRLSFTSPSLAGLWAAAEAGLGVTMRTRIGLPATLTVLDNLPALPDIALTLHQAGRATPVVDRLKQILVETVHDGIGTVELGAAA